MSGAISGRVSNAASPGLPDFSVSLFDIVDPLPFVEIQNSRSSANSALRSSRHMPSQQDGIAPCFARGTASEAPEYQDFDGAPPKCGGLSLVRSKRSTVAPTL